MARIALVRYSDLVRYDAAAGKLLVLDQQHAPALVPITQADDQAGLLRALAAIEPLAHSFALGYTLALAAREWCTRPTDAQRGAIIQIVQQLKATSPNAGALLDAALERADTALVRGEEAEREIITLVAERLRLADRAADRCGRHAVNLVDGGDRVLTYGFGGPPLLTLLGALPALEPPMLLVAAGAEAGGTLLMASAGAAGIPAQLSGRDDEVPNLCIVVAWALARDGSAVCASGCGPVIEQARWQGVPCYLLAPFGPHADAETATQLVPTVGAVDVVMPNLISAIVTDRGMYRPAMVERYLGESDAPPDVIPLT